MREYRSISYPLSCWLLIKSYKDTKIQFPFGIISICRNFAFTMFEGKKIMYVHGFMSAGSTHTAQILRDMMPELPS